MNTRENTDKSVNSIKLELKQSNHSNIMYHIKLILGLTMFVIYFQSSYLIKINSTSDSKV